MGVGGLMGLGENKRQEGDNGWTQRAKKWKWMIHAKLVIHFSEMRV